MTLLQRWSKSFFILHWDRNQSNLPLCSGQGILIKLIFQTISQRSGGTNVQVDPLMMYIPGGPGHQQIPLTVDGGYRACQGQLVST